MLSKEQVEEIVRLTIARMGQSAPVAPTAPAGGAVLRPAAAVGGGSYGGWRFDSANDAVEAAWTAFLQLGELSLAKRRELIEAMRQAARANARHLAELAHEETGYGHVEDKVVKNLLAADKTPGVEDIPTEAFTGDGGFTLVEHAPFGVIGSIIPSTNPTATVINNAISMIAAGNTVVFSPHPAAKKSSQEAIRIMHEALVAHGAPAGIITTPAEPSMENSQAVMKHPRVRLLAVTGGEAIVKVAMNSGKKAVCAGPGNPPVIVDETAEIEKAGKRTADGASYENNILCVAEKEVFCVQTVFDRFLAELEKNGAYQIRGGDIDKVLRTVLMEKDGKYIPSRKFVGRDASYILDQCGISYTGKPRLVICEVDRNHPFVTTEMLMPVLACVRVSDVDEAIREAVRAENGCWHSAIMHSTNVRNMSRAAKALNTTIFVKNAPSYSGLGMDAEGYATLTIATPTGEGLTSARTFTRARRCVLHDDFRIL